MITIYLLDFFVVKLIRLNYTILINLRNRESAALSNIAKGEQICY